MRRCYTRVCNFYYGDESKFLIKKKKTIPLNNNKEISFDALEIITRKYKKKIFIKKINSLPKLLRQQVRLDLKKIKSKKKIFQILIFKKYQI